MGRKRMKLSRKDKSMVPAILIEAKMSNLTPNRLDVIHMLLAEIGKESDIDENLVYVLTAETYAQLKNFKHNNGEVAVDQAYKVLKHKIWGDTTQKDYGISGASYEIQTVKGWGKRVNFFQSIEYMDGRGEVVLKVSEPFKEMLVEVKKQKGRKYFAALQYVLPMQSVYSKRLYMMCKEFENSGIRFSEKYDFTLFREKIGAPASYADARIVDRVLEQAKKEINILSDIEIDYELTYKPGKGRNGKVITGVFFRIVKKEKNQLPGQISIEDFPEALPDKKAYESRNKLKDQLKELIPKLTEQDISIILSVAESREIGDENIIKITEYVSKKNTNNAVGYIRMLMEHGFSDPVKTYAKGSWNNIEQHDYDFEELERIALQKAGVDLESWRDKNK